MYLYLIAELYITILWLLKLFLLSTSSDSEYDENGIHSDYAGLERQEQQVWGQ